MNIRKIIKEEYKNFINEHEYKIDHRAPDGNNGSPLHDVTNTLGKDFYEHSVDTLARYYGGGNSYDTQSTSIIKYYKGKPNKPITIYRAIPDFDKEINDKIKNLNFIINYYDKFNFYPPIRTYKKYATIVDEYENIINKENNKMSYDELNIEILKRIYQEKENLKSTKNKYKINDGDWVTIIKQYAIDHGKREFGKYKILTKTVKAKEIFTEGYLEEWGYSLNNTINESNERESAIQQFVDIIDIDPDDPRRKQYIDKLKNDYNYEYIKPELRYKEDFKIINNLINKKYNKITNKGVEFYFITGKVNNLLRIIKIDIYNKNDDFIGKVGFNINTFKKSIVIGGAEINEEYRRKGIYTSIVDYIEDVANKYNLEIKEGSRSQDARKFWQDRENKNINKQ